MALKAIDVLRGSFTGKSTAGAISLPGARVGDEVFNVNIGGPYDNESGPFEQTISVDDQIQQTSSSNLSTFTFQVTLLRSIATS